MLVVQVDHLYTKTLQTGITALAYIFWFAIDAKELAIRGALVAEFGRKYDLIAPALKRAAKKFLVATHRIHISGIEEIDTEVQRPVNGRN